MAKCFIKVDTSIAQFQIKYFLLETIADGPGLFFLHHLKGLTICIFKIVRPSEGTHLKNKNFIKNNFGFLKNNFITTNRKEENFCFSLPFGQIKLFEQISNNILVEILVFRKLYC